MEDFSIENTFYVVNQTGQFFPTLTYKKDNIPVGDSISMCITVSWAPADHGNTFELMKPVVGFEKCKEAEHGKLIWNSNDSEFGVDVPIWRQTSYDIDCTSDEDCDSYCAGYNALYVKGIKGKKCYSYEVLNYVCFTIEYDSVLGEYKYGGGCLKDNGHYTMVKAEKNKVYKFEDIFIEVRNKKDPVVYAGELSSHSYSFGTTFSFLAAFLNFLIVVCLLILAFVAFTLFNLKRRQAVTSELIEKGPEVNDSKI
jgi:hypothetical protein